MKMIDAGEYGMRSERWLRGRIGNLEAAAARTERAIEDVPADLPHKVATFRTWAQRHREKAAHLRSLLKKEQQA
jgi:hypothetical protein